MEDQTIWERLEQGRQAKAAKGGYAGYGSPAFGQKSLDGELLKVPFLTSDLTPHGRQPAKNRAASGERT